MRFLRLSDFRIPDTTILEESFKSQGYEEGRAKHFFLREPVQPVCLTFGQTNFQTNGTIYHRLQGEKSLLENLQGMAVIEFPTIHVVEIIPSTWTIQGLPG